MILGAGKVEEREPQATGEKATEITTDKERQEEKGTKELAGRPRRKAHKGTSRKTKEESP